MGFQSFVAKTMMKLPDSWLVKMSGGAPVTIAGRTLEPQLQMMAWQGRENPPLSTVGAEAAQAGALEQLKMIEAKPLAGVTREEFTIDGPNANAIPVRLHKPLTQDAAAPMMAYFHMGGGVVGSYDWANHMCDLIAQTAGCPVLNVEYRKAPAHVFPAGLEDCIAAYEWCLRNAETHGAPAGMASIGGDSMGGNFSAIIAQEMQREHKPAPELQLLIYPATDIMQHYPSKDHFKDTFSLSQDTMDWFMDTYLPEGTDRLQPRLSPGRISKLENLPAAIVITAGFDPLSDEGDEYAKRLETDGVDVMHKRYDALAHGFTAFSEVSPGSAKACREIAGMVKDMYARRKVAV